jgi:hypothetical protein
VPNLFDGHNDYIATERANAFRTFARNQHIILYAYSNAIHLIDPRLNRKHHTRLQRQLVALYYIRLLMRLQANAVPGAMPN